MGSATLWRRPAANNVPFEYVSGPRFHQFKKAAHIMHQAKNYAPVAPDDSVPSPFGTVGSTPGAVARNEFCSNGSSAVPARVKAIF